MLPTIGSCERLQFPEFGITGMIVRVDTGARRSALHAEQITYSKEDGLKFVHFKIVTGSPGKFVSFPAKCRLHGKRTIVSSNGTLSVRPVIKTLVRLGRHEWIDQISLIDRSMMSYRMLLGRLSIKGKFIVDVSQKFILD